METLFFESQALTLQVIVVDNASRDDSTTSIAKLFPQVKLIALEENIGFGKANNLASKYVESDWILLLNPDTQVLSNSIEKMLSFALKQTQSCLIGGRVYKENGELDPASCWGEPTVWSTFCASIGLSTVFRRNPVFDPESLGSWQRDTIKEVDVISGCLIMLHKKLWHDLKGFDPQFFMYSEDTDLSIRARKAAAKLLIYPEARIMHHSGASEQNKPAKIIRLFSAKILLFNKHWPSWQALLGRQLLVLHSAFRTIVYALIQNVNPQYKQSYKDWQQIWRKRVIWKNPKP